MVKKLILLLIFCCGLIKANELIYAIDSQNFPLVVSLVDKNYSILFAEEGETALTAAAKNFGPNPDKIFDFLVSCGVDLNKGNRRGETPLILSLRGLQLHRAKHLIDKGANPNKVSRGLRPLSFAIINKHPNIVQLLVNAPKINLNYKNKAGDTPLLASMKSKFEKGVKELIDAGADLDIPDKDGNNPVMIAIKTSNAEWLKWLLDKGANPNIPDKSGNYPIEIAIEKYGDGCLQLLFDSPFTFLNIKLPKYGTPLLMALKLRKEEAALEIIEKGSSLEQTDEKQNTPLITAIEKRLPVIVTRLLEKGVDLSKKNKGDYSALACAILSLNLTILGEVLSAPSVDLNENLGVYGSPLLMSIMIDHIPAAFALIDDGADINKEVDITISSPRPLFEAIRHNRVSIALRLIQRGAEVNFKDKTSGHTPLELAVRIFNPWIDSRVGEPILENREIIEALLVTGAEVTNYVQEKIRCDQVARELIPLVKSYYPHA